MFAGGHCAFLEKPERFLAAVEPFLEGVTAERPVAAAAR
jgi:hypothetical protein